MRSAIELALPVALLNFPVERSLPCSSVLQSPSFYLPINFSLNGSVGLKKISNAKMLKLKLCYNLWKTYLILLAPFTGVMEWVLSAWCTSTVKKQTKYQAGPSSWPWTKANQIGTLLSHSLRQRPYQALVSCCLWRRLPFSRRSRQIFTKDGGYEGHVRVGYTLSILHIADVFFCFKWV